MKLMNMLAGTALVIATAMPALADDDPFLSTQNGEGSGTETGLGVSTATAGTAAVLAGVLILMSDDGSSVTTSTTGTGANR